mgnify:CR=1 FL=1
MARHHLFLLLLLLLSTTPSCALYPNANDPDHDHTASAKRLDADGEHDEDAAEAFRAAVRFNPTSIATSLNLAVALLRYGNLSQSRIAFENTFALAVQLKKPKNVFNRITRNFNTLQKEWEQVFNEQMDPVESSLDPHAFQLLMRHRKPDNLPLHMLSEKKYLDKETSDRGQQGLESRVPPGTQTPPTMVTLDNIHGMDTVLNYVGGDDFQTNYWEQWPLHIRATGAMNGLVSLQELLKDGPYGYGSEKTRAPHRNVNYIKREFGNKDTIARDTPQHAKDLLSAMRRNYTVQMLGTHYWMPAVANMSYWLSQTTSRPVSVNLYATPQNQQVSLVPHSDFQCALMVQLEGRKRWRLWKLPDIWLPVRYRHIRGRDDGDIVDKEWLGKPYMDVILEPGDVLYVPRGCLHLTSTVEEKKKTKRPRSLFEKKNNLLTPSIHLTVGMEAMWDHGVSATWEAFFGAGEFFRHGEKTRDCLLLCCWYLFFVRSSLSMTVDESSFTLFFFLLFVGVGHCQ